MKKNKEFELLVDSEDELKKLGIKPVSAEEFILANGETIKKFVGNAYFEYKGKIRASPVIFGDKDVYILGITTLETFGMIIDPIKRD